MNRGLRASERAYRLLLHLFPGEMRRRFGRDMAELFRDSLRRQCRGKGRLGLIRAWRRSLADLLANALMERFQQVKEKLRPQQHSPSGAASASMGRRGAFLPGTGRDLHYALRTLMRHPASTLLIIITLALGVGANAAMYGLAHRLLLSAPPGIREADQVVRIQFEGSGLRGKPFVMGTASYPVFGSLQAGARRFSGLAAVHNQEMVLQEGSAQRKIPASMVSAGYFDLLGVEPILGRFPGRGDHRPPDGLPVAVLSHRFWESRLAGDRQAIGRTLRLDGRLFTIIGVAPEGFSGDDLKTVDVWVPLAAGLQKRADDWRFRPDLRIVSVLGRLAPHASRQEARSELTQILQESARGPSALPEWQIVLGSLIPGRQAEGVTREGQIALWLSATAGLVFLIALANAATLLLLRSLRRRRETALRLSLGCSRWGLLRQMLAESLLPSAAGGAAGLLVAYWCAELVRGQLMPEITPLHWADRRILSAAAAASLLAALTSGLVPAWQSRSVGLMEGLKSSGSTPGRGRSRLQFALLAAQTGISLILLAGAGLFLRSLDEMASQDLGFNAQRLALARIEFGPGVSEAEKDALYERLREQARTLPQAVSAFPVLSLPFGPHLTLPLSIPGRNAQSLFPGQLPRLYGADPAFFAALGMRVVQGRGFSRDDHRRAPLVAIVNQSMARAVWPDEDPLGKCLGVDFEPGVWPPRPAQNPPCRRIVGVVSDTRPQRLRFEEELTALQYYLPFQQLPALPGLPQSRIWSLVIETEGPAEEHLASLSSALRGLLPAAQAEFIEVRPYQRLIDPQMRPFRLGAALFSLFGMLALTLAAVGLYSVLSYAAAQRRPEIGVRLALGASAGGVARLVAIEGLKVALAGILPGAVLALAAGRILAPQLYRTSPYDPAVLTGAALSLVAAALLASLLPALHASRTDPNQVLRTE